MNIKEIEKKLLNSGVEFTKKTHSYYYNGKKVPISSTGFVGEFGSFDREFELVKKATKLGVTTEVLSADWEYAAYYGASKGTIVHDHIDHYFNNKVYTWKVPKKIRKEDVKKFSAAVEVCVHHAKNFIQDYYLDGSLSVLSIEPPLGLLDVNGNCVIAGKPDNLSVTKNGEIFLLDYKTNKSLNTRSQYKTKLKPPFNFLDDCELSKYSIQLAIYRLMFEQLTDLKIHSSHLVWMNENNTNYEVIKTIPIADDLLRNCLKISNRSEQGSALYL